MRRGGVLSGGCAHALHTGCLQLYAAMHKERPDGSVHSSHYCYCSRSSQPSGQAGKARCRWCQMLAPGTWLAPRTAPAPSPWRHHSRSSSPHPPSPPPVPTHPTLPHGATGSARILRLGHRCAACGLRAQRLSLEHIVTRGSSFSSSTSRSRPAAASARPLLRTRQLPYSTVGSGAG